MLGKMGPESWRSPAAIAKPLEFHSLKGIVDYLASAHDPVDGHALVIDGPEGVRLIGKLTSEFRQREVLATAAPYLSPGFPFGKYLDPETFIVAMQTGFEEDATTAMVMKLVGNITDEQVANFSDDGVTQQVTARAGIAKVANVEVPSRLILRPYRTFPEVQQPQSRYILRLKRGGEGALPTAALHEVVDNRWKHDAIAAIELCLRTLLDKAGVEMSVFA